MISSFQKLESNKERRANYRQKKKFREMEKWKEKGESGRYHSSVLLGGPSQEVYRRQANRQM